MLADENTRRALGLAKSAFTNAIYRGLPLDVYVRDIGYASRLVRETSRVLPRFYQSHDAYLMFYQTYTAVSKSIKKENKAAPAWREIIRSTISRDEFYELNRLTAGSPELAAAAAAKFLGALLRKKNVESLNKKAQQGEDTSRLLGSIAEEIGGVLGDTLMTVKEYKETREAVETALSVLAGSGGGGFEKEALSVWHFLKEPEAFRKRVRLLLSTRVFFAKFTTAVPTSIQHLQVASTYGGVRGVERMTSERQICDVLPSELSLAQLCDVGRALLAVKIAQRQLMVYQRAASIVPVVFVDKSGSMAEDISWNRDKKTQKIALAVGLALALHAKLGADVYLFDTECEKVSPAKIIETLLSIEADGGTDIDPVLEEISRIGKKDYMYIIISDGITDASEKVLEAFKKTGLAAKTKLILVPPAHDGYNWCRLLRSHGNVYYARDVAQFEEAARKTLQ